MAQMTSRERVIAALNHEEPDRVPLDIGGGGSTSILVEGYENLKQHLGITAETRAMVNAFRIARLDEQTMRRLGSDCRPITIHRPDWDLSPIGIETYQDMWGVTWKKVGYGGDAYYWEHAGSPLAEATIADLDAHAWPDLDSPGFTAGLEAEIRTLHEDTDYAIMAESGFKSFWELGYMLAGYERLVMDIALDPEFVSALMNKLLDVNMVMTGRFLDIVGPYIQVFRSGDDLGTQRGPLFSPQAFRTLIKPVYKRYFDLVKSKTDAKIFFHSCGNIVEFIDDLAEVGVDIINPVQVTAMPDTAALKARFGDRVTFWGGIDSQHILPNGTPADVEAEVRQRIRDLGPGGGFVAASVHNMQPDIPPANIVAMADAVRRFGAYPLT